MKLDVSKIVKSEGASLEFCEDIPFDVITFNGQDFPFTSPARAEGVIKNNGGTLYLEANVHTEFITYCARCLKQLNESFDFSVSECFTTADVGDDSDMLPIISNTVDLKGAVEDNFCTSIPFVFLCNEDCQGLCPKCGKDLNDGACECENDDVDPRLAGLKAFLKND